MANLRLQHLRGGLSERAGKYHQEFPDDLGMSGITDYEFIDGWFKRTANVGLSPQSGVMMLFRKSDANITRAR